MLQDDQRLLPVRLPDLELSASKDMSQVKLCFNKVSSYSNFGITTPSRLRHILKPLYIFASRVMKLFLIGNSI